MYYVKNLYHKVMEHHIFCCSILDECFAVAVLILIFVSFSIS